MNNKTLTRSSDHKILGGVCSGIARYAGIEPWVVQLICAILMIAYPPLIFVYLLLVIILPLDRNVGLETDFSEPGQPEAFSATESSVFPESGAGSDNRIILGILLITLGIILLMHYLFPWASLEKLWPLLLIILGGYLIWQSVAPAPKATDDSVENKTGTTGTVDQFPDENPSKTENNEK